MTPAVFVGTMIVHRREGIAMLGPANGGRERVERGGPVGGGGDVDRHGADRTEGV